MSDKIVYVVHCIDTEGPLYESLDATFERLQNVFDVDIEPSRENLEQLQRCEIDLGEQTRAVARMVAPHALNYMDTWDRVDEQLERLMADSYRRRYPDSEGNGWIFNWFCVDHVGYETNPRRRDLGYHHVFDHYREKIWETSSERDGVHFHYHPVPFSRQANHCATHWFAHTDTLFQVLARRVIDRGWFPSTNRPGFHTTRPDSHWFLEQFMPFDYASQAHDDAGDQPDLGGGRFGDWRRAPKSWHPYHPAHDDYQSIGTCRRTIFRCLNVGTRLRLLRQADVDLAFAEAQEHGPVVLAFTDHDYRNMAPDVESVHEMLMCAVERYPDITFHHAEARAAARSTLGLTREAPCTLSVEVVDGVVRIESDKDTFGPQPFLALKTTDDRYLHDNLDIDVPHRRWSYVLDEQTVPVPALEAIGVASNDITGNVTVIVNTGGRVRATTL